MNALSVVVVNIERDSLVHICQIFALTRFAELQLKVAKLALHAAILPRARFARTGQLYFLCVNTVTDVCETGIRYLDQNAIWRAQYAYLAHPVKRCGLIR